MTTAFPGAIDAFTNPTASDPLDSVTVPHASQHANINDAVEAIETAIGTTAAPVLAKLASPTFTGVPAAPTAAVATNTTQIATTAFVIANAGIQPFGFTAGLYYMPIGVSQSNFFTTEDVTYYTPFTVLKTNTFDRIAITSGSGFTGSAVVRAGIYNNDSATGKPSTVVLDAGTVSPTAASTVYQITISQSLSAGNYWIAVNMQTASVDPNFHGKIFTTANALGYTISTTGSTTVSAGGWQETGVTGAFATAGTLTSNNQCISATLRSA